MKPDWDKLISEYKDSKTSLVADVDCTAAGKDLCEKNGVSGYPTIKWGDPSDLKDYQGGRTFSDLKSFADNNLGPTCGPESLDLCDEAQKKLVAKYQKMDVDELDMKIEEDEAKLAKVEAAAKKPIDSLNNQIKDLKEKAQKAQRQKDDKLAKEQKKLGLAMMKKVKASRVAADADAAEQADFDKDESSDKKEDL